MPPVMMPMMVCIPSTGWLKGVRMYIRAESGPMMSNRLAEPNIESPGKGWKPMATPSSSHVRQKGS